MVSMAGTAADTAPLGRRAEAAAAQERPFGPRFMTPMLMGATLNPINSSVIATALVAGVVGGLARNLTALVVARVLIGLGTSAGYPAAMLMLRRRSAQAGL